MIVVERAAPLLTVQDRGRFGYLADGVTSSGPLDALALDVANALVGNTADAAVLEGCLGGAEFSVRNSVDLALTGASLEVRLNDRSVASYERIRANAGDRLTIDRVEQGAVWYLAAAGGIDVPLVLGSRSTLLSAGLGGVGGAPLKKGTELSLDTSHGAAAPARPVPTMLRSQLDDRPIAFCEAPRADALTGDAWTAFFAQTFTVSRAMSRVGYRLEGEPIASRLAADIASEPACRGAMQLPPEGQPIVLMADHPTIGGYPIIGAVPAHAVGALAQRAPGRHVRFVRVSTEAASEAFFRAQDALSEWLSGG